MFQDYDHSLKFQVIWNLFNHKIRKKVIQALQSSFLILHPVPCSFPFSPPLCPVILLDRRLCPTAATPAHPVSMFGDWAPSRLRTFWSGLIKGGENRIHRCVSWPKGAGHHLFTSAPPSVQKEDEELGWVEHKCLLWAFFISKLHIREFPGDSERHAVSCLHGF